MALPLDQKKTFHEPLPDCSDKRWSDRLRRTASTLGCLSQPEIRDIVSSAPHLRDSYGELLSTLDRYGMHIAGDLMTELDYGGIGEAHQRELEKTRRRIVSLVSELQRERRAPV